ncbi:hypothetical protein BP6252_08410 [Coleophoma cylindrospora]|uniref:Uncharacterized protein n=1 Tax=Coleophoma cylindrospora TaxID=1849047 RepID=A0A3D8R617_9HELO|nr:hypothetical protein BP6252_08410 [Coleophoma cylindrospora]
MGDGNRGHLQRLNRRYWQGEGWLSKIRLCGEQARREGQQYFWVDTCCIDKSNSNELAEAINSMFRWYCKAVKCYVLLSDVSRPASDLDENSPQLSWECELTFRKSRWFTRGWTLQELIAPLSVDFFSKDWELLGNKTTLERQICEITGIPVKALRGAPLSDFSIHERMSWAEIRQTTRDEDKAYSLLGISNVYMPLIYSEGRENAMKRLREEIDKVSKGSQREDFSITFSLDNVIGIENFVARETELVEMHRHLCGDGSRRTVILHGLGGIGKTQLTIAYAKRHKDNYSAIFWLNIKDEDSLKQSFAKVARQISRQHPSARQLISIEVEKDLDKVVDRVKAWLSLPNNTRWLVIYDNYDNPELAGNTDPTAVDIRKYLPEAYQGSIVITTRSSHVRNGHTIQVRKLMNVRDSLEVLSYTSRRDGLMDNPEAIKLAQELDGLPLALATAGAYLDQVAISASDYLRLYKESWAKLQRRSPELSSYEDRTLYSTWQVSYNQVEKRNSLSAKLLHLWAYFDSQDLWFELLQHSNSADPRWLQELVEDELSFHDAVRVLCDHGLVEVDTSSQELIESRGYTKLAVKIVASHVPSEEAVQPWLTERRLLQHAARCSYIVNGLDVDDDMAWAYFGLGFLYKSQSKLDEAEKMYQRALDGYEKVCGPDHVSTLDTVNNLGCFYYGQGKLDEAEKMYQRALDGKEKALGPDHVSTLETVNNLGTLYHDQGKLDEAEKMHQRALDGKEKALGPDHVSTLETVNDLGYLYQSQDKPDEAEKMYQRALDGKENALGPDHVSTLYTVNNLGYLYQSQGKPDEAEKMYQRALDGKEKALGPNHVSTLMTVGNLGNLYEDQGKLDEAEIMYQWALDGMENALGPDHVSTLDTVNNFGILYQSQGKLDEAEKMYQRVLDEYEKILGANKTTTYIPALNTMYNLGTLFELQAELAKCRAMYSKALIGSEKVFGPDHSKSRVLRDALQALDSRTDFKVFDHMEETVIDSLREQNSNSKTKRYKLLRKLGLR